MPCTLPQPAPTAAMPASTPLPTGSAASATTRTLRSAQPSSSAIETVAAIDNRVASRSIASRVATPNTPGPVSTSCGRGSADGQSTSARSACARSRSIACCCPSSSKPGARVCATSSAVRRSSVNHAPSRPSGPGPPNDASSRSEARVGSPAATGRTSGAPADRSSSWSRSNARARDCVPRSSSTSSQRASNTA
jgi:hypothetical protein